MILKPIAPQTLAGMKKDSASYETAKALIQANANVVDYLSPGDSVSAANFSLPTGASVFGVTGTFKRGTASVQFSTGVLPNPTVTLKFPSGLFNDKPFAQVVRNGGSGGLSFTYTESIQSLAITVQGTPVLNSTYVFQWAVQS